MSVATQKGPAGDVPDVPMEDNTPKQSQQGTYSTCLAYTGCAVCFAPSSTKNSEADMRMMILYTTFTVSFIYISGQMIAGIAAQSMSLISDSAQGIVDCMTYAVSIYAQHHIDSTSDFQSMKRIGMYSAFWGASTLIVMCFLLSIMALYDLLSPYAQEQDPNPTVMLIAGIANLILDIVCITMMNTGASLDGLLPWLMGQHSKKEAPVYKAVADAENSYGTDPLIEKASQEKEQASQEKEQHAISSMLNVGSSLAHLITDCLRSVIIITAAALIFYGYDAQKVDCIASLVVNSFAGYIGVTLLIEARKVAVEINEPLVPYLC